MINRLFAAFLSTCIIIGLNANAQSISTIGEIFDYQVGDLFHYTFAVTTFNDEEQAIKNYEILDRYYSVNNDTLYFIRKVDIKKAIINSPIEYEHYVDTISYSKLDSLILKGDIDTVYIDSLKYNGRKINFCEEHYASGTTYSSTEFVEGCGISLSTFKETESFYYYVDMVEELVYYKKGTEEWGTPDIVSVVFPERQSSSVNVFPNPANNFFSVEAENIQTIRVRNASGQLILETNEKNNIDISNLQNAVYFLEIVTNEFITNLKLLKQ